MNKHTKNLMVASIYVSLIAFAGCSKSSESTSHVEDAAVNEHVRSALQQNDQLRSFAITVETTNGDVRLNGVVDNQAQIDEAIKIARGSRGAHTVHSHLSLKQ
jgi:osmotically-inducible protein OsmY